MGQISVRQESLEKALATIKRAIDYLRNVKKELDLVQISPSEKELTQAQEDLFLSARDSLIQRFEYTVDLFWKYLKAVMEDHLKVTLKSTAPKSIIRQAVQVRLVTEAEGEALVEMIDYRNQTSHVYREEVAEAISHGVPEFYTLMDGIFKRISSNLD